MIGASLVNAPCACAPPFNTTSPRRSAPTAAEPGAAYACGDIYSLGVIVFEALTGRAPFAAETADDYYHRHLTAEVPPLGGDFAEDLDRAIGRALAKSPTARYSDA